MTVDSPPWDALFSLRSDLVAQARALGLSLEDAEDVASEAILRAALKVDLDIERAGGWLRVVARRLAIDTFRRRERCAAFDVTATDARQPAPQDDVDDRLEAAWVAGVVEGLPARQRIVLQRRSEEMTPESIAAAMGCSYKTVESLTSRARTSVRRALAATLALVAGTPVVVRRGVGLSGGMQVVTVAASIPLVAATLIAVTPTAEAIATHHAAFATAPRAFDEVQHRGTEAWQSVASPVAWMQAPTSPTAASEERSAHVHVAPATTGPVTHGGLSTTRDREDETLLETTLRCVREGPTVSVDTVGCT